MTPDKMAELLARARAGIEQSKQQAADALEQMLEQQEVQNVDLTAAGISEASLETDSGQDAAVDVIRDVIDTLSASNRNETGVSGQISSAEALAQASKKQLGVTRDVTLNEKQQAANETVLAGEDCCIIGPAGTGKTTCMRTITRTLLDAEQRLPVLSEGTKYLIQGKPGCVICSYTRKAVNNIRHAVQPELKEHTITLHKLLEFAPQFYDIEDPIDPGEFKRTMRFEPTRNSDNPLPRELELIVFEEASMIGTDLYSLLQDAMRNHPHQEVFLGDIQQLPPIFGSAVLGYKLVTLKTIELTQVYRQALENPILALAWKILEGRTDLFASKPVDSYEVDTGKKKVQRKRWPVLEAWNQKTYNDKGEFVGELKFQPWQKRLQDETALDICGAQFCAWIDNDYYNPEEDMILLPFNKAFGTIELNKKIGQHLGDKREAVVHEVIAGFTRYYLSVGDRVMYDKEDAFITAISRNVEYIGKQPAVASRWLDRWGCLQQPPSEAELTDAVANEAELSDAALDALMVSAADSETRVTVASHDIVIRYAYSDEEQVLSKAAEVNNLLGGYAITVHKAQGSEYERGFFVMHHSHAVMNQRELLYTAPTRFKKFLHIICEPDTFEKGIKSQRIEGDSLAEKAEFFKGKHKEGGDEAMQAFKSGGKYKVRELPATQDIQKNDVHIRSLRDPSGQDTILHSLEQQEKPVIDIAHKLHPDMTLQEVKQIIKAEQAEQQRREDNPHHGHYTDDDTFAE